MSEEKKKNEDVTDSRAKLLAAGFIGFVLGIPVAIWAGTHLALARDPWIFTEGALLPLLSVLDCVMTVIAVSSVVGAIYFLGTQNIHKEIIEELNKPS